MRIWERLKEWLGGSRSRKDRRLYGLDGEMQVSLKKVANGEGRSEEEVAKELLAAGLDVYASGGEARRRWEKLSGREQDVAALACLGYANKQIALRLNITPETVKTHMHNVLLKYELKTRTELAMLLGHWDFSAWEEVKNAHRRV